MSLLLLLAGCAETPAAVKDSSNDSAAAPDDTGDTGGSTPPVPPCGDGTWGMITDPSAAVHVSATSGEDSGDGTQAAPVRTFAQALALVEAGGPKALAVWPGTYAEHVEILPGPDAPGAFDGLRIEGCSPAEVAIEAPGMEQAGVLVQSSVSVVIRGITVSGGLQGVWYRYAQGSVEDVAITGSRRVGLRISGILTDGIDRMTVDRVVVSNVEADPDAGGAGFGIVVQDREVDFDTVTVRSAVLVGVLIDGAKAAVTTNGLVVEDTAADESGYLGRGVQVQYAEDVQILGGSIARSVDAAIYAVQAPRLVVDGATIDDVAAGVSDTGAPTGDAIVVTSDAGSGGYAPEDYPVTLSGNTVGGWVAERAGIYLESVEGTLAGNADVSGAEFIFRDAAAQVSGQTAGELSGFALARSPADVASLDSP